LTELILALGSKAVHSQAPFTRSVLIYGPPSNGKTLLSHAIATETGSVFLDVSLANLTKLLEMDDPKLLVHIIFKVSKENLFSGVVLTQ
jgi:ATP-dependent 26S proteasome regulatory subunit